MENRSSENIIERLFPPIKVNKKWMVLTLVYLSLLFTTIGTYRSFKTDPYMLIEGISKWGLTSTLWHAFSLQGAFPFLMPIFIIALVITIHKSIKMGFIIFLIGIAANTLILLFQIISSGESFGYLLIFILYPLFMSIPFFILAFAIRIIAKTPIIMKIVILLIPFIVLGVLFSAVTIESKNISSESCPNKPVNQQDTCYRKLALENESIPQCFEMIAINTMGDCIRDIAIILDQNGILEISTCDKTQEEYKKNVCLKAIAIAINDKEICNMIINEFNKKDCIYYTELLNP